MTERIIGSYELRILLAAAAAAALAVIGLCFTLIVRANHTQQFREQAAMNCENINLVKTAIRGQIDDEERAVRRNRNLSPDQLEFIETYYDRQRTRFAPDVCPQP